MGCCFIPYDFKKFLGPAVISNILHCLIFEQLVSGTKFQKALKKPVRDGFIAFFYGNGTFLLDFYQKLLPEYSNKGKRDYLL